MRNKIKNQGFTLIELLVVFSIIVLLGSISFSMSRTARSKARDARRLVDMENLIKALYISYLNYGKVGCYGRIGTTGGYDMSRNNSNFMRFLITQSIIAKAPQDPINNSTYQYSYTSFRNPGSSQCGAYGYIDFVTENRISGCPGNGLLLNNNHCHIFVPQRPPCANILDDPRNLCRVSGVPLADPASSTDY